MIYDLLAPFYDAINADIDYKAWAEFIEKIFNKTMKTKPELVLDLGCGTGSMTLALANLGYDMTGIDYSAEMLDIARERAEKAKKDVLWLQQDMTEFELYGTVDATVCCLDCINHLTDEDALSDCLNLVHNYLIPDGIFIFDVNGKMKFEKIYADNSYTMEEDGALCVWQNYYDSDERICDFYITLFKERADGLYQRYDEEQCERMYTLYELKDYLGKTGFDFIGGYSDFDFTPGDDNNERLYIVAKCRK